jgi:hypothetical protein
MELIRNPAHIPSSASQSTRESGRGKKCYKVVRYFQVMDRTRFLKVHCIPEVGSVIKRHMSNETSLNTHFHPRNNSLDKLASWLHPHD